MKIEMLIDVVKNYGIKSLVLLGVTFLVLWFIKPQFKKETNKDKEIPGSP